MAGITNHDRVGKALDLLRQGLTPYIRRELEAVLGNGWREEIVAAYTKDKLIAGQVNDDGDWDCQLALVVMWDYWNNVFRKSLGHPERSLVSELRTARNGWAHQEQFSANDAYRCMDSVERLLLAISAPQAELVGNEKNLLLREKFQQETRDARKVQSELPGLEGQPIAGLKSWREVVIPHEDVSSGRFQQAEFAADLWEVYRRNAKPEYNDPIEFFRRTYMTEGLKSLLGSALNRICGQGGDPIMELQTNFGGGKTHSMLALFHLFSGTEFAKLPGIEELTRKSSLKIKSKQVNRAVLVGTRIATGQPSTKSDGTVTHTLWGELAWQLGGKAGYAMVAKADQTASSPGEALHHLIEKYSPCLILIDEWVAYARQLHDDGKLCGGSFETQFTFAQALTETVKTVDHAMLVVSIPASDSHGSPHYDSKISDIEIGGDRGVSSLLRLKNVIGRIQTAWRPASEEESYAIVRRRLFNDIADPSLFKARDAVIDAFYRMYSEQTTEFPRECREPAYRQRMQECYPIHPELFERLYQDWATLERFQRTRGVLRFMASVIHALWERNDTTLLIMPSAVPIDDAKVQPEITQYLENGWVPVIERDVDGPDAISRRIDLEIPTMGRYSACRRVARTLYMASAPTANTPHKGADALRVKVGCVQPGEATATFDNALRRLADAAMHLYSEGSRYWFDTQPTVQRLARDKATEWPPDQVADEIRNRLRLEGRASFAGLHPCPASSADVPDDHSIRLVILPPTAYHETKPDGDSRAIAAAKDILERRGSVPRHCRNALVFLAPEQKAMQSLEEAVRQYLAWRWIDEHKGEKDLNLTPGVVRQVEERKVQADSTSRQRIAEAYCILIAPEQTNPQSADIQWQPIRLSGSGSIAERAWNKLSRDQKVYSKMAGSVLRQELDRVPLWQGEHVTVRLLADYFSQFLYLPRLKDDGVLISAIEDGCRILSWQTDAFAFAEAYDEASQRYRGLRAGGMVGSFILQGEIVMNGLLVKPSAVQAQIDKDAKAKETEVKVTGPVTGGTIGDPFGALIPVPSGTGSSSSGAKGGAPSVQTPKKKFIVTATLDPVKGPMQFKTLSEEIIVHLASKHGVKVTVSVDIQAEAPNGFDDATIRILKENSTALKLNPDIE